MHKFSQGKHFSHRKKWDTFGYIICHSFFLCRIILKQILSNNYRVKVKSCVQAIRIRRHKKKVTIFYIGSRLHFSLVHAFKGKEGDTGKQKLMYRNTETKRTVTRSPICDLF